MNNTNNNKNSNKSNYINNYNNCDKYSSSIKNYITNHPTDDESPPKINKSVIERIYQLGNPICQYGLYLKYSKGYKVFKIPVDIGAKCPNKDGTLDKDGCIFCPSMGRPISVKYCNSKYSLKEQIEIQMERQKKKGINKFYIYFYPGTNTYGDIEYLKEVWDFALSYNEVVGLSLGTRPDCISNKVLKVLNNYVKEGYEIWIDLGIQSMKEETLKILNRKHTVMDTINSIKLCKKHDILVCGHVILGLPNESWNDMMSTGILLSKLGIDALKIYPLIVVKNTKLEKIYWKGEYKTLDEKQYTHLLCDFLERISPYVLIQRVSKDKTPDEIIVSPTWNISRLKILNDAINELKRRGTKQGYYWMGY